MVEAGLHVKEIRRRYFPCDPEYARVLVVLFTIIYLDRQLNFNAGLPLSLREADIDIPETVSCLLSCVEILFLQGDRRKRCPRTSRL